MSLTASSAEGLVYLEGVTETAFRKAPEVGVECTTYRAFIGSTLSTAPMPSRLRHLD
jgi:hypothetical protein